LLKRKPAVAGFLFEDSSPCAIIATRIRREPLSCGGATAPPAGEEPGTSQEESTPAEEPKEEEATATAISHDLGGRENCLMCHETGLGDADPIPADHAGRANETCTTCHQPE
jgi:hypothetical protein